MDEARLKQLEDYATSGMCQRNENPLAKHMRELIASLREAWRERDEHWFRVRALEEELSTLNRISTGYFEGQVANLERAARAEAEALDWHRVADDRTKEILRLQAVREAAEEVWGHWDNRTVIAMYANGDAALISLRRALDAAKEVGNAPRSGV